MIGLFLGEKDIPNEIIKKIEKKKIKYFIIDLTKNNKFKKNKNSFFINIGKFGEILKLIKSKKCNKVIVVDNYSNDDQLVAYKKKYSWVNWIENSKNFGFSKACNIGAQKVKTKWLLFLNTDTIIPENTLNHYGPNSKDRRLFCSQTKIFIRLDIPVL